MVSCLVSRFRATPKLPRLHGTKLALADSAATLRTITT